jgi:protoporphyrin/coproporphyrin ferrochelatase
MNERTAVLLLAHGTPDTLDEIPEYLRNITGGRPLPESVVKEIRHRYSLIGASPLTSLTLEQGRLLAQELCLPVYVGMRNWKPYIADVAGKMREDGIERAVVICLAPQNSRTSVGLYRRAVFAAADGIEIDFVEGWADHPLLADAFAERLRAVWNPFTKEASAPVPVLFTAHSVPLRTVQPQPATDSAAAQPADPYEAEARRTAALVAERVPGLQPDNWFFAFQSQGMSGGPWLGPTVEDTLTELRQRGIQKLVIQPVGFLCDHVEILYDIDIGFRQFAANLDMELRRPESLNASSLLIAALADIARQRLARLGIAQAG